MIPVTDNEMDKSDRLLDQLLDQKKKKKNQNVLTKGYRDVAKILE